MLKGVILSEKKFLSFNFSSNKNKKASSHSLSGIISNPVVLNGSTLILNYKIKKTLEIIPCSRPMRCSFTQPKLTFRSKRLPKESLILWGLNINFINDLIISLYFLRSRPVCVQTVNKSFCPLFSLKNYLDKSVFFCYNTLAE